MNNQGDVIFGILGTAGTFGLGAINLWLGIMAGTLTCVVMTLRVRKEWRNRNK